MKNVSLHGLSINCVANQWRAFFIEYWRACPADVSALAVTLAYNPHRAGTAGQCLRRDPVTEAPLGLVPGSGVPPQHGRPTVSVTRNITTYEVHADLDRLHRVVDRRLFGSHFNRRSGFNRSSYSGCIEHLTANTHVHLIWRVLDNRIDGATEIITERWPEVISSGSSSIRIVRDDGWARYVGKTARTFSCADDLIVLSRPAHS
jgi:hypothetical protein